jgi:NAD(P)-dependent dehydrogenase (short-subunit alcohol dehydrogenase family)
MNERHKSSFVFGAALVGAAFATRALVRRSRFYDLSGKTVLITGGSRGLGLILARRFLDEGARVAICAREHEELERAAEELAARGAAAAFACDVTVQSQVAELVRRVRERFGAIDVLVNDAGIIQVGPAELMTVEDYRDAMDIHFWAPLYTMLEVLPDMRRRGEGRIVNIASLGGRISFPHLSPYCASKFALVGLSEGLRAELAPENIFVTTVCPPPMRTGSTGHAMFKGQNLAEYAWFTMGSAVPLFSIDADRAAAAIVDACRRGDAGVSFSSAVDVVAKIHALFPTLVTEILSAVHGALPAADGIGTQAKSGEESRSILTPHWLTALLDRAAARNNETVTTAQAE